MAEVMNLIDFADSWQDYTIAKRIYDAYKRRAAALGYPFTILDPDVDLPVDQGTTVAGFISAMQRAIEGLAGAGWLDKDYVLEFDNLAEHGAFVGFPMSSDELLVAAGLTGVTSTNKYWRRITEGGVAPPTLDYTAGAEDDPYLYGRLESKDLAGPWLFEDLQTALKYMVRIPTTIYGLTRTESLFVRGRDDVPGYDALSDEDRRVEVWDFVATAWDSSTSPTYSASVDMPTKSIGCWKTVVGEDPDAEYTQTLNGAYDATCRILFKEDESAKTAYLFGDTFVTWPPLFELKDTVLIDPESLTVEGASFYEPYTTPFSGNYSISDASTATPRGGEYQKSERIMQDVIADLDFGDVPA